MASFVSADDVATLLRRALTAEETAQVELLAEMVSAEVQSATGQTIELVTDDTVVLHGSWERWLQLPQRPVVSVSAVSVNDVNAAAGTWALVVDRLYRGNLPTINGPDCDLDFRTWLGPAARVSVTYTHGFAEIPGDIKAACLRGILRMLNNPDGVKSETIGGYTYSVDGNELLDKNDRDALALKYSGEV